MNPKREPQSSLAEQLAWLLSPSAVALYEQIVVAPVHVAADSPERMELLHAGLARVLVATGELFALPPEAALARAIHLATQRWLAVAPDFDGVLDAIGALGLQPPLAVAPGQLDTSAERQQALEHLLVSAQSSVWMLQPYPDWVSEEELADQSSWTTFDHETPSHISHRFIYEDRLLGFPEFHESLAAELAMGADIRITSTPPPTFLFIIDGTAAAYFPQRHGPGSITSDAGLVGLLQLSYEAAWDRAVPLRRERVLSPAHHQIHALVALGHNNRTIGSMLDLHERTVRRRVHELLEHHGVTSRAALIRLGVAGAVVTG